MAAPLCPACWASTPGAPAIAVAAAPAFRILRRIGSIIGVLLDRCCGPCVRPQRLQRSAWRSAAPHGRYRTLRDAVRKRRTFNELHHARDGAVWFLPAVDLRDVGMVQRSEHFRFTLEACEAFRVVRHSGG